MMRKMAQVVLTTTLLAFGFFWAACGDDDDDEEAEIQTDHDYIVKDCTAHEDCPIPLECIYYSRTDSTLCSGQCYGQHSCSEGCCVETGYGMYCVPDEMCEENE